VVWCFTDGPLTRPVRPIVRPCRRSGRGPEAGRAEWGSSIAIEYQRMEQVLALRAWRWAAKNEVRSLSSCQRGPSTRRGVRVRHQFPQFGGLCEDLPAARKTSHQEFIDAAPDVDESLGPGDARDLGRFRRALRTGWMSSQQKCLRARTAVRRRIDGEPLGQRCPGRCSLRTRAALGEMTAMRAWRRSGWRARGTVTQKEIRRWTFRVA